MPQIRFTFFCVSSAEDGKKNIGEFCRNQMNMAKLTWNPKDPPEAGGPVEFVWDGKPVSIADTKGEYKLIEFPADKAPAQALKLVKENWKKPTDAVIPVFVCRAAWDERRDGGKPSDGLMRGFTITKRGVPWFTGERAILLLVLRAGSLTLAHELSHWFGFTHEDVANEVSNVGKDGLGGPNIEATQYHNMLRWAKGPNFRQRLGV